MFLARDVEWRNKIVSTFREAGFPEGEQQWGLLAMSAFGTKRTSRDVRGLVAIGGKRTSRQQPNSVANDPL